MRAAFMLPDMHEAATFRWRKCWTRSLTMLDFADVLLDPDAYVCIWRDGELYVEPLTAG